jgi:hypothetical protein
LAAIVIAADINAILANRSSKNRWICMMISCVGPRRWIILASRFERRGGSPPRKISRGGGEPRPLAAALCCCARGAALRGPPPPFCK